LGVRVSQFKTDPPVVRVVADLEEPRRFRIFPCAGRVLIRIFSVKAPLKVASSEPAPSPLPENPTQTARSSVSPPIHHAAPFPVMPPVPTSPPPELHPSRNDIRYDHGMLSIHAENVTLASAIVGVGRALRANVEMPSGSGQEKIFSSIGPAPPDQAIEALLTGSSLNYILVEGQQPDRKMTLVVMSKSSAPAQPAPAETITPAQQGSRDGMQEPVEDEAIPDPPEPGVPEPSPEIPEPSPEQNEGPPPSHGEPLPQQDRDQQFPQQQQERDQQLPPQPDPGPEDQGRNPPP
jgi:hypothetical protein